jgi:hypothetical protein
VEGTAVKSLFISVHLMMAKLAEMCNAVTNLKGLNLNLDSVVWWTVNN